MQIGGDAMQHSNRAYIQGLAPRDLCLVNADTPFLATASGLPLEIFYDTAGYPLRLINNRNNVSGQLV